MNTISKSKIRKRLFLILISVMVILAFNTLSVFAEEAEESVLLPLGFRFSEVITDVDWSSGVPVFEVWPPFYTYLTLHFSYVEILEIIELDTTTYYGGAWIYLDAWCVAYFS